MRIMTRLIFFIAMVFLSLVSVYTTYASLHDSILPTPAIPIPIGANQVWNCSVPALGLAIAIGLMLFALKLAIIDGHKRLNLVGLLGLTFVGFISIAFNIDVLYRTADRDFIIRYENDRMRGVYEEYLGKVQTALSEKRATLLRQVATQEGELESEVKGLREAPSGYGNRARQEDYHLTVLKKTTEVDLQLVEEALTAKQKVDVLLNQTEAPSNIQQVMDFQDKLRASAKDVGGVAGIMMPTAVKPENPFFVVFQRLGNFRTIGFKEVFIVLVGFLLDLGDIIGYSMIPNKRKFDTWTRPAYHPAPDFVGPEVVPAAAPAVSELEFREPAPETPRPDLDESGLANEAVPVDGTGDSSLPVEDTPAAANETPARKSRPFRFGRR
ncbi:MAG: hypothetical protein HZB26_03030 [Candidatus Hydrogenedentes bacterium]|nr:hypothetical protein [Candidatus Hydrogenedentota bacterium]